jgi:site-specific recombinase XerD
MTTDNHTDPAAAGFPGSLSQRAAEVDSAAVDEVPERPLAQALRPRLDPQFADDLAGRGLDEALALALGYAVKDRAANTRRGYAADLADFEAYCVQHQVLALPAAPAVIAAYLSVRAHREPKLKLASLARRLAAIRKVHELNGYQGLDNPGRHPDVLRAWRGIRRDLTWSQQQAAEASTEEVRAMAAMCPPNRFIGVRDRAMLLLHYVLGTRRSELVALDVEDLIVVDRGLVVTVWRRKTDQEARDLDLIAVPYGQHPATCPVRAWLAWQEAAGFTTGPTFRPVHPRSRLDSPDAPVIRAQLQAAPRLRDEKVSLLLKRLARRAGLKDPDRYSSHSTRRGFAVELRRHGATDLEIAEAGGWHNLEQVRRLARSSAIWENPPAGRLGL